MKKALRILCLILCAAVLSTSFFPWNAAATEGRNTGSKIIVSLGDSYSSGEGIPPFFDQEETATIKENRPDWLAHRSKLAWSGMLTLPEVGKMSDHHRTNWFFVASSGAKTCDLKGEQKKDVDRVTKGSHYLVPQLNIFQHLKEVGKKADYVTVTIGGNDAGFKDIVSNAAITNRYFCPNALCAHIAGVWKKFYAPNGIRDNIKQAYYDISNAAGKQATIIVAGYPKLFSSKGTIIFDFVESNFINEQVSRFNKEIQSIVCECQKDGMNICFVSVEEAFNGHEAYSKDSYLNPVILGVQTEDLNSKGLVSSYSIHPNYTGACVYAECVQSAIDDLENKKASEYPEFKFDYYAAQLWVGEYYGRRNDSEVTDILNIWEIRNDGTMRVSMKRGDKPTPETEVISIDNARFVGDYQAIFDYTNQSGQTMSGSMYFYRNDQSIEVGVVIEKSNIPEIKADTEVFRNEWMATIDYIDTPEEPSPTPVQTEKTAFGIYSAYVADRFHNGQGWGNNPRFGLYDADHDGVEELYCIYDEGDIAYSETIMEIFKIQGDQVVSVYRSSKVAAGAPGFAFQFDKEKNILYAAFYNSEPGGEYDGQIILTQYYIEEVIHVTDYSVVQRYESTVYKALDRCSMYDEPLYQECRLDGQEIDVRDAPGFGENDLIVSDYGYPVDPPYEPAGYSLDQFILSARPDWAGNDF